MKTLLNKARYYFLHGLAIILAIITAPIGICTLVMALLIDILKEIADEDDADEQPGEKKADEK